MTTCRLHLCPQVQPFYIAAIYLAHSPAHCICTCMSSNLRMSPGSVSNVFGRLSIHAPSAGLRPPEYSRPENAVDYLAGLRRDNSHVDVTVGPGCTTGQIIMQRRRMERNRACGLGPQGKTATDFAGRNVPRWPLRLLPRCLQVTAAAAVMAYCAAITAAAILTPVRAGPPRLPALLSRYSTMAAKLHSGPGKPVGFICGISFSWLARMGSYREPGYGPGRRGPLSSRNTQAQMSCAPSQQPGSPA
jgi:hypothetical protein